MSTLEDVDMG